MGATFVIAVAPVTYGVGIIGLDTEGHACADVLARLGVRTSRIPLNSIFAVITILEAAGGLQDENALFCVRRP